MCIAEALRNPTDTHTHTHTFSLNVYDKTILLCLKNLMGYLHLSFVLHVKGYE